MAKETHQKAEPHCSATWCWFAVTSLAFLLPHFIALECDRMFISNPDGPRNGTFSAPIMANPLNHSRQCIYTFIGAPDERVQVAFHNFNLRGSPPECNHEYLDMYAEIEDPAFDLISTPFGGRYCGRIIPHRRVSMYRTLVIGFYTDASFVDPDVFHGVYEFSKAAQYVVGTPAPNTVCSFTIYSDRKREGQFISPTYPGVYPKNLLCQYRFLGGTGQRVRLEFMDFDLFYGGPHCPFDYVKIYDGTSPEDPLIGIYCGQQRNLMVYSSAEKLFVQFLTLQRTADNQNRGFSGWFEFSERFVNLGFIGKNDGEHIRGTECDQKILSRKESNGTVYSPNYPFLYHPNIICRYFIYGMEDAQHLERVRLEFEKFEISSNDAECADAYLKMYLQGQEQREAAEEYDHIVCGPELPSPVMSEGPRLVMIFSSGASQGQGFRARYIFETDYKVPGTASPDGTCHFSYVSDSRTSGDFNSPRYPANYPSSTRCTYVFRGKPGEQIKFVFNYFKTKAELGPSSYGYNDMCVEDWLEIYEVFPNGRERKMGRYCAKTAPGPVVSDLGIHSMKVILNTDESDVASGFSATYTFITAMSKFGECGQNITGADNGVITSPGFPNPYEPHRQVCHWYITVRPNHKILLVFTFFMIEGDPIERGCPGAVVRVWLDLDQPPLEMCGEGLSNNTRETVSASSILKISFITAQKAVGSGGFRATWTELQEGPACDEFHCAINGFCIASSLRCNDLENCGVNDNSDEDFCVHSGSIDLYLVIGIASGVCLLTVMTLCLVCHRKRKRRRNHHHHPALPPYEHRQPLPREVSGMHFVSVDTV